MKKIVLMVLMVVVWQVSCANKEAEVKKAKLAPFSGAVVTVESGGGYTYMEIKGTSGNFWAATRPIEVKKGDTVQLIHPMKMEKFPVKSLKRTFDIIYFADDVLVNGRGHMGDDSKPMGMGMGNKAVNPHGGDTATKMKNPHQMGTTHMAGEAAIDASRIKPQNGSVAIADLLKNPEKFVGKTVKVHGIVTKYLPMIMKKNWIHLKDATCGKAHIVVTTDETFKAGETVLVSGKVEVNKDFGFGYKYDVLLTGAKSDK
ncbi:MAG: hypothetical protein GXO70_02965 [Acidobacteria bacterium]|nr:hypothetical protein [Acidobacteriota bacterium]